MGHFIDSIDRKLVTLLMADARQSSDVLAKKLMISPATVRRRISKLVKQDIIRMVALPDPSRVGLPLRVVIALNVAPEKLDLIASQLSSCSEVIFLVVTSGRFDIFAIAWFPTTDNLFDFMQTVIGNLEGIRNTETFICLQDRKSYVDTSHIPVHSHWVITEPL